MPGSLARVLHLPHLPPRGWLAAATAVAVLGVAVAWQWPPEVAAPPDRALSLEREQCVEAAVLVHDVRWAAACAVLGEQGQGSGIADCELPQDRAAPLNALLRQAEQRCLADG